MEDWVKSDIKWEGFNELSKGEKSAFEDLIKYASKIKDKPTFNILLIGHSGVGKTSTMESIVKMRNFATSHGLEENPNDRMTRVYSFKSESFILNFIEAEPLVNTGGCFGDSLLLFIDDLKESNDSIDVILYVDRTDVYSMNATDLMVAKAITELFGVEAWNRVLIVLTHCDALEESTEKDFHIRREAELLDWIVKGGDIKKDTLKERVVYIDNSRKCNEPKSVEEIHDDDVAITTLIWKIGDIARDNISKSPLLLNPIPQDAYDDFSERIFRDCKTKYFEMINNVNNPEGKQQEWRSFKFDDISRDKLFPAFVPEEWKTNHLPEKALHSIENIKSMVKLKGNAFTILVMGRGGSGKSSTANSIIGSNVFPVNKTKGSQEIMLWSGSTSNFTLRIIEIPEFQLYGQVHPKYYEAIKLFWRKYGVNALLYVERLDEWKRDDLMSSNVGKFFGPKILNQTIIVLTHRMTSRQPERRNKFEYRREIIAGRIWDASSYFELEMGELAMGKFEIGEFEVRVVAVENCEKHLAGNNIRSEWIAELFEGLSEISKPERCVFQISALANDVPVCRPRYLHGKLEYDELERSDWMVFPDYPRFNNWWGRDYTEEELENVVVRILFHYSKSGRRKMQQKVARKRLRRR